MALSTVLSRRSLARLGAVAAATAGLVVALSTPAHAYIARAYQGDDYASVGEDHWYVEVCDMEQDGRSVYGEFTTTGGWFTVWDTNGSAAGCGNDTSPNLNRITSVRVCEQRPKPPFPSDACSDWKAVP